MCFGNSSRKTDKQKCLVWPLEHPPSCIDDRVQHGAAIGYSLFDTRLLVASLFRVSSRAFGAQERFVQESYRRVDACNRAHFYLWVSNRYVKVYGPHQVKQTGCGLVLFWHKPAAAGGSSKRKTRRLWMCGGQRLSVPGESSCRREFGRNFAENGDCVCIALFPPHYNIPCPVRAPLTLQVVQRTHPTRGCDGGRPRRSLRGLVGQGPPRGDGGGVGPAVRAAIYGRGQVPRSAARPAGDADELGGLEGAPRSSACLVLYCCMRCVRVGACLAHLDV